jgi:hypothetical protein
MDGRPDGWINGWIDWRMYELKDGLLNGKYNGSMYG